MGTLSATSVSLSASGSIDADPDCTSSQRDPQSTEVFYARRHTFTLDAAATVSVGLSRSSPGQVVTYLVLTDDSGTVLGRNAGHHRHGGSGLSYLLLKAGTYTIEATTVAAGAIGGYSVAVSWAAADPCVRDLGTLDGANPSVSGSGIIAVDGSCTSSLRDPQSTSTHYARRHTFTLDAAATVSAELGPAGSESFLILIDSGGVEVGRDQGHSGRRGSRPARLGLYLLQAGTYTLEATTANPEVVRRYTLGVYWEPADACVEDLGALGSADSSLSGSGIVAVDNSCVSSLRDPQSTDTYYARRHTFTLDAAATVSVQVDPAGPSSFLVLSDGTGAEIGRAQGTSGSHNARSQPARRAFRLPVGTYTVEATKSDAGSVGHYTASVEWFAADSCVRDLGTLGSSNSTVSVSGVIAQDAGCVSALRDPQSTDVFYARRYTFMLDAAATVSVQLGGATPLRTHLVLSDSSGMVISRSSGPQLLLDAGTYTVEATTERADDTGEFSLQARWWPADTCAEDLGTLDAATPSVSGSGIIAVDGSCTSSLRDPQATEVFYARRHTFTLDAAATVSVSLSRSLPGQVVTYLVLTDGAGTEVGRAAGHHRYGGSGLSYLLLQAGTYTIEATTVTAGETGGYSFGVSWAAADACEQDLGTLDGANPSPSDSGTIAVDGSCTSSLRDPQSTDTHYARRHTFTLDAAATVSVQVGPTGAESFLVLADSAGSEIGRDRGSSSRSYRQPARLEHYLLPAGTYTVEATKFDPGAVGPYTVEVSWAPADDCRRDLGSLGAAMPSLSGLGIIAVDGSCKSSLREPDSEATFYARRHSFRLDAAATVSVQVGPAGPASSLILSDSSGTEIGRAKGTSGGRNVRPQPAQRAFRLPAGTYTVEATKTDAGSVGPYTASVEWFAADPCVRGLGTLDASAPSASATGVIAQDSGCESSLRDLHSTDVFYARRHTFTLDTAATVSVHLSRTSPGSVRTYLVLTDGSGAEVGRTAGHYIGGGAGLERLLLDAGTYTIEATTVAAGDTGGYLIGVSWWPADSCVEHLGTVDAATPSLSGAGIVAVDSDCTSALRDPHSTEVFYARRHTFTLDAAATVSVGLSRTLPGSVRTYLVLTDGSGAEMGRHAGHLRSGSSWLSYLLLQAGTYTIEATTSDAGATGGYTASVSWAAADACERDLGTLDGANPSASGSGIIAVDNTCISSFRDAQSADTYYARRHTFTLDAAATVSVQVGPNRPESFLILSDSTGTELGRAQGNSSWRGSAPARLDTLLLPAGTYTIEATTATPEVVHAYTVRVDRSPLWRHVTASAATASESDGTVVLTLSAAVPSVPGPLSEVSAFSVWWETEAGTAVPGSDYAHVSGVVSVPADGRRATITVPLVDDSAAESIESFIVQLTGASGATLANTAATATIADDDPASRATNMTASACVEPRVSAVVGDVFDIAQPGSSGLTDVFVDVGLSCEGGTAGIGGYRTGVEILTGPAAPLSSGWCVRGGVSPTTDSLGPGRGCVAAVTGTGLLSVEAEATHILRIPDSAVGEPHQLRVWIDLNKNGVRDPGEEADIFAADFESRVQGISSGGRFALAEDFEVTRLDVGSDRVGRAGQWAVLRLAAEVPTGEFAYDPALSTVVPVRVPLANAVVGASVYAGPSDTAEVMCVVSPVLGMVSPGSSSRCVTDAEGMLTLRYRVGAPPVTATGPQQDDIRIWWDRNGDGTHDGAPNHPAREPSDTIAMPIAKAAVNYVALGDSYSSGEVGPNPAPGMYVSGENPADGECHRWDLAYPTLIEEGFLGEDLGIDADLEIFACTGAITLNVFDPADLDGSSTVREQHLTDRPSSSAALDEPVYRLVSPRGRVLVHERDPRWEPRQAVSLAGEHERSGVDLVTVTIGGNDAGFAGVIMRCVTVGCGPVRSEVFDEVRDKVASTLSHVKEAAPDASVFLLGYPALTPAFEGCESATPEMVDSFQRTGLSSAFLSFGLSDGCVGAIRGYAERVAMCPALDAGRVLHQATGWDAFWWDAVAFVLTANLEIDAAEAIRLRDAARGMDGALRSAAASAGVHYVSVLDESADARPDLSSRDHAACDDEPWVHGLEFDDAKSPPVSDGSLHPNALGHRGYARILEQYIRDRTAAGAALSEAGLPANPRRRGVPGSGPRNRSAVSGEQVADAKSDAQPRNADTADTEAETLGTEGYLTQERTSTVSGCGAPFASPGEQVRLTAGGFAADAEVSFTARAASLGTASLSAPEIADATADADGAIDVSWAVPAAPDAATDPAPRAYAADASGGNTAGGTHTARMIVPIVAYPAAAPCAVDDSASTTLGVAVQISVLANDVAPTGGVLDAATVAVRPAVGGTFAVNASTGTVTFTPDAGFWGTVETSYVVFDGWGIGVEAGLSVTVDAGCTITGIAGVSLIEGTSGDDVICVPDRDDWRAFHVIDAKGGDDVILGGAGVEWIYGGDGEDTIWANGGDDRIIAGAGADTVRGGAGIDAVYSIDTADTVVDDDYEMVLSPSRVVAQSGPEPTDDWAWVDVSQTVLVDVLSNDHDPNEDLDPSTLQIVAVPASGTAAAVEDPDGRVVVSYTASDGGGSDSFAYEVCDALGSCAQAEVTVMVGTADCTIVGTQGADTIRGTPGDDVICGLGGGDTIRGIGGTDVIVGGLGDDDINAGDGADLVWGGPGADTLDGGPGDDTVWGAAGDDALVASSGSDRLDGGPGDDTVTGGGGDDLIWGGPGADILDGHAGDDTVWGGPGDDMLRGGNGDDTIWGGAGADTLTGGAGADSLHGGAGGDRLDGNAQNDTLWGGPGADTLNGGGHDDELHGGPGSDTLRGGAGDDRLWGGIDADSLDGGDGIDHLDGGGGVDACRRASTVVGCGPGGGS